MRSTSRLALVTLLPGISPTAAGINPWCHAVQRSHRATISSGIVGAMEIDGVTSHPITVSTDTNLSGVASAGATVQAGSSLTVSGVLTGSLVLQAGSRAEISGVFSGGCEAAGHLTIQGVFDGEIQHDGGTIRCAVGCVINGMRLTENGTLIPADDNGHRRTHEPSVYWRMLPTQEFVRE